MKIGSDSYSFHRYFGIDFTPHELLEILEGVQDESGGGHSPSRLTWSLRLGWDARRKTSRLLVWPTYEAGCLGQLRGSER